MPAPPLYAYVHKRASRCIRTQTGVNGGEAAGGSSDVIKVNANYQSRLE